MPMEDQDNSIGRYDTNQFDANYGQPQQDSRPPNTPADRMKRKGPPAGRRA